LEKEKINGYDDKSKEEINLAMGDNQ